MASKRKCNFCKQYFDKTEGIDRGVSFYCSMDHMYGTKKRNGPKPVKTKNQLLFTTSLKKKIRQRDGNRCIFLCGNKDMEVHHIVYRSELGSIDPLGKMWREEDLNEPSNLVTLCSFHHHDVVHKNKEKWQPVLRAYIWLLASTGKRYSPKEILREWK